MTDDTTPMPTDLLRAWVKSWHRRPTNNADARLYGAAVAALPPEREWVTADTPLNTEVTRDTWFRRTWLAGWRRNGDPVMENEGGHTWTTSLDGLYVVKEVES